ncbi:putative secreted protein (Por secretion system target) [Nonlabens dokdonensis]|uniref:VCBS n=2 Tax=Nonlabens dokdonensis TaxID=328515 RepID=L7WCL7_NONDD|nr:LamG-like jellyroll fold domain-containing protein [Nonlabens dokdonensis]AGC77987.1 VCBS [Nonlabens dokdonensis DSW-6]PZX37058.1 putative secreted protein (Por secretion system target) [Nonlabens dokdonensis]
MNKITYLNRRNIILLFFFFVLQISWSQVTIYDANFSNYSGSNFWTQNVVSGSGWSIGANAGHPFGDGNYMFSSKDANGRYLPNTNSSITSPVIDLTGYDRMTFSMDIDSKFPNTYDGFHIEYTNDGIEWIVLGKIDDRAVNWYNFGSLSGTTAFGFGNWTGDRTWETVSIDLPSQGFDNQSNVRFRIVLGTSGYNHDIGVAFDNVKIVGYSQQVKNYSDCGLGIGQNLELWLNTRTLAGLSDGDRVSQWTNISSLNPLSNISAEWTSATSSGALRPTYYDNPAKNTNFNPVVSFDGTNEMFGKSGFYNRDIFIVINPTATISASRPTEDVFLGDDYLTYAGSQDVTGISINDTSARYGPYPDIAAYNQGAQASYGRAIVHPTLVYDRPVIFNARLNATGDGMDLYLDGVDLGLTLDPALMREENATTFKDILNSRYWLGRSEFFGPSFTGDILEIMSFSERKPDIDRQRLESYLAVKYGITLGLFAVPEINLPHVPGAYFDSDGNPLWNAVSDAGYTYNVAGIGYDDCSLLNQKQAKSVDPFTFITVGLGDIYDTNSANPSTFEASGDFLMWGSTRSTLTALPDALEVTLGPSLVTTFTDVTERTWKFKEISQVGNDIPEVKLSVSTTGLASLPTLVGNDAYVMILADDDAFTTNVETVFLETEGTNQTAFYDFDGTRYVKFGVAHEVIASKDILFDGTNDYVAMGDELELSGDYTISAWVKTNGSNSNGTNKTIVSKRGSGTDGYHFYLRDDNHIEMTHNGSSTITSNTALNDGVWYYLTLTYDSGQASLYIDGFRDRRRNIDPTSTNTSKFCIGSRYVDKNNILDNFSGSIDEIRIFNEAISQRQIRFLMNQEIEKDGTGIKGAIIPNTISRNDISSLEWDSLEAYFNMNTYIGTHLNDASGKKHRGSLIQPDNFNINEQTAPLPYISNSDADWNTAAAWTNGDSMFIPGSRRLINGNNRSINWNIAVVNHEITADNRNYTLLSLEVSNTGKLLVENDRGLTLTHQLKLDGSIDLVGESQLIQQNNSDLVASTTGKIEIDQQGTSNNFDYNYWSSPVSTINDGTNNNGFSIAEVLKDGTLVNNPRDLTFTARNVPNGTPGTASVAATISGRWLWKYGNTTSNTYANWEYAGPDGNQFTGEGWTMKGTGAAGTTQNYVFVGKPNNGNINLDIDNGNDYLVGNPYPSALDAHEFISDNPDTDGTVYFWEHWGGNTHILANYQGGYATYNYSGGVGNATIGTSNPDVNQGGIPTKRPEQFIPVGQGFFVTGINDNGQIRFRNDQRQFVKESSGQSLFVSAPGASPIAAAGDINTPTDPRMKIRIGFDSSNLIHRQLLVTVDSSATFGIDRGYDGKLLDEQMDDMAWKSSNEKLTIQGIPSVNDLTELPLFIKINNDSTFNIVIDELRNVPVDQDVFVKDAVLNTYTDIKNGSYTSPMLASGTYEDRFSITFSQQSTLSEEVPLINDNDLIVFTPSGLEQLHVKKSNTILLEDLTLINMLGQNVKTYDISNENDIIKVDISQLASGNYIVKMNSNYGILTRKVIIE